MGGGWNFEIKPLSCARGLPTCSTPEDVPMDKTHVEWSWCLLTSHTAAEIGIGVSVSVLPALYVFINVILIKSFYILHYKSLFPCSNCCGTALLYIGSTGSPLEADWQGVSSGQD